VVSEYFQPVSARTYDEDSILIDRVLGGADPNAFQRLYERHYARVYGIAYGVLLNHDDAVDATQEVFTKLHRNLKRFDRRSKFSTWLHRVAVNRCIQYARSLKGRKSQVSLDTIEHVAASAPSIEDREVVQDTLALLRPDDRLILTLYYWQEMSLGEIAEALGTQENAAKTRLFRARERFKSLFAGTEKVEA
jgi:RNA polymerase sigma-70 factor (ECF subfamily)